MEPEPPPANTSDDGKPPSTATDHHHQQRSYECNFCKRGFTNAQALGGHMNIHRKDKNKLKHSTTTPPNPAAETPSPTATTTNPFSISHQGNWFSSTSQDEMMQPLPLFDHRDTAVQRHVDQPPLQDGDVDLELRLGHGEPLPESSSENKSASATTRKFF